MTDTPQSIHSGGSPLPITMREVHIVKAGGPEVLETRSVALPVAAPGEVLIRVEAAGVNRPDVLQRAGQYSMPPGANPVPGLEVAGTIVAMAENVTRFALGDKVCALVNGGGYAEYCVAPAGQVLPVPGGLSMVQSAAIPETFFTVWANLFEMGGAIKGDRVLIHGGTSGIGTTALMLCKERGIEAFATVGSETKCGVVCQLGAEPINYKTHNFAEVLRERTSGQGVDVILDIMGASYFEQNVASLARGGRLVIIGFLGGASVSMMSLVSVTSKKASITGSMMRSRSVEEKAGIASALRSHVWPMLSARRCLPLIEATFSLAHAAQAHRLMEEGTHVGKIVLTVA